MTINDAKKQSVTDRRTDRPTDRADHRVACTRLKRDVYLEDLLLVADGLIVEVVTGTDVSGSRQLGHHSLVVLEVDHAVAVDV